MAKLNRIYKLTIQTNLLNEALEISDPIGISFNVDRGIYAGVNSMDIDIFNLNPDHRNLLFQDTYDPVAYKHIVLEAGYAGMGLTVIFIGNIFNAYSYRQGSDIVTHIHAMDGGLDTSTTNSAMTFGKGVELKDVINGLMGGFPHLKPGTQNINDYTFKRPVVVDGNNFQLIRKYAGGDVFVDLEEVNIMKTKDVIKGYVPLINDESGLLGTPQRRNTSLSVELMFEPRIVVGQVIEVQSSIAPQFDGQFKVIGLQHQGTINVAQSGKCTTRLELFVGTQLYGKFNVINAQQQQVAPKSV